jgi:transcriptional regulator with XRE-family HTH domain
MSLQEIGIFIKKRRQFLNLRQQDLSELTNINTRTIHLIEQGSGNPSFETLNKIAEILGLEIQVKVKLID